MPRPARLALLIGALWAGFLGAGIGVRRGIWPPLVHVLLLATVVLFGADIVLIARAYHIAGHYPDGFLLCALGALILAVLVPSEPVAIAGLLLTAAWTSAETFGFWAAVHLPFLILWGAFMAVALWRRWVVARHAGFLAILFWCAISIVWRDAYLSVYLVALYVPIGFAIALLAGLCADKPPRHGFSATLLTYSVILFLGALACLGIKPLQYYAFVVGPGASWIAAFLALSAIITALVLKPAIGRRNWSDVLGVVLALAVLGVLATLFFNIFAPFFENWFSKAAFILASAWIVMRGHLGRRRAILNIGFIFLLISIVRVYADADRAFFHSRLLISGSVIAFVVTAAILFLLYRTLRARWDAEADT